MEADLVRLSYRELAERMGKTADAARVLASRRAKAGKWRIIEGNHPQDKKYVELPRADLEELAVPEEEMGEVKPKPKQSEPVVEALCEMLADSQEQIGSLTDKLIAAKDDLAAEKDAHRKTGEELAGSVMREAALAGALEESAAAVRRLEGEIAALQRSKRRIFSGR
jgi:hypothetical protein